jgi:hypothetical protein
MRSHRARFTAVCATACLTLGVGNAAAAPQQEGLVNVNVSDVIVQVPIGVAANICGTTANVLSTAVDVGGVRCTADAGSGDTIAWNGGGGNGRQEGLVNVNVSDVLLQVPVSVAANLCDTTVNVLAQAVDVGGTRCTSTAGAGDVIAWNR